MMRILIGTDGSEGAHRALELAATLGLRLNAHLEVIHVVTLEDPPLDEHTDHATRARNAAEALGVTSIRAETVASNDVARSIIAVANSDHVDLIVVGKRGLGRITGLLLGSVSQKLVSEAPCAVMVV